MANEPWPQAARWNLTVIFTGDSFSCHSLKLLLKSFSFAYHPKERSWTPGTRAAYGDSKVELGSRGSHGVNGCPCSQFDAAALALQAGAEKSSPHCGYRPTLGLSSPGAEPGAALLESSTGFPGSWTLARATASP